MPWWVRLWCSYLQYYPIWASSTEQLVYIYETPLQGAGGASIIELVPICRWLLTLSSSFAHARASTRLRKKDVAEKREGGELQLLRLVDSPINSPKRRKVKLNTVVRESSGKGARFPIRLQGARKWETSRKKSWRIKRKVKNSFSFSFESIVIYWCISKSLYRPYPAVGHDNIFWIRQI